MRIGIITFHASLNCGSMLQAFALQTMLQERYHADVDIIDFSSRGQRQMYSFIDTKPRPRILKRNIALLPYYKEYKKYKHDFEVFKNTYFNLTTKSYKKTKELNTLRDKYDLLVAGGDQVWNVRCRDFDNVYFLDFQTKARKISYSPSLGAVNIINYAKTPELYRKLLDDFSHLSVREPNGQKWLEELTGRQVEIVADPTMLFDKNEWKEQIGLYDINSKFIFYYAFDYGNKQINEALKKVADELGVEVYVIERKAWNVCHLKEYGFKVFEYADPKAFLTMINSADYVVTDSFHGTVFSCLFNKQFVNCRHNIAQDKDDDRSTSLLESLGLSDRFIFGEEMKSEDLTRKIDYSVVNSRISDLREKGLKYLDKAVLNEVECNE